MVDYRIKFRHVPSINQSYTQAELAPNEGKTVESTIIIINYWTLLTRTVSSTSSTNLDFISSLRNPSNLNLAPKHLNNCTSRPICVTCDASIVMFMSYVMSSCSRSHCFCLFHVNFQSHSRCVTTLPNFLSAFVISTISSAYLEFINWLKPPPNTSATCNSNSAIIPKWYGVHVYTLVMLPDYDKVDILKARTYFSHFFFFFSGKPAGAVLHLVIPKQLWMGLGVKKDIGRLHFFY